MKLFDIIEGSEVNGPGLRLVLWFSGCDRDCPGCFNKEAQDINNSKEYELSYILNLLQNPSQQYQGISISGGEPFYQWEALYNLLKAVKDLNEREGKNFDILVFTGYTYEELITDERFAKILNLIDILVDGPFIQELKEGNTCYLTGSSNQRVLYLKDGKISKNASNDFDISTKAQEERFSSELIIGKDGSIKLTGFDDIKLWESPKTPSAKK